MNIYWIVDLYLTHRKFQLSYVHLEEITKFFLDLVDLRNVCVC